MLEEKGNLWNYPDHIVKCITTNGIIKKNGELVMGKGIALQTKERFPDIPKILGQWVERNGNKLCYIAKYGICSFPTKLHWRDKSDLELIKQSCYDLNNMTETLNCLAVLPRPGCNNGQLNWEIEVKPVISQILSDRIYIISL